MNSIGDGWQAAKPRLEVLGGSNHPRDRRIIILSGPTSGASDPILDEPGIARNAMTDEEARALIARAGTARAAYTTGDHTHVGRMHYVCDNDMLYARNWSRLGARSLEEPTRVTGEVHEIPSLRVWRCVCFSGTMGVLLPSGDVAERREWRHGVSLLSDLFPELRAGSDPALSSFRLLRVRIDSLAGTSLICYR